MSWDIYIQDLPAVPSVAEIPDDFRPRSIGALEEVRKKILDIVPFAEQQDDDWMFVRTGDVDLSINLTREEGTDELRCIAIHVHGGDNSPMCVAAIIHALELRALDTGTGEFFDPVALGKGYEQWSAYRDQVMRHLRSS